MKRLSTAAGYCIGVFGILSLVLWLTGCKTDPHVFDDLPPRGGSNTNKPSDGRKIDKFQIDDVVKLTYSGPGVTKAPHEERIKGDGSITPPDIGPVIAAGKTPGELQKELQTLYDRIYNGLTVTVQDSRIYYVVGDGNVNRPGPQQYLGETDVVKAISAAGGVTEFAADTIEIARAGTNIRIKVSYKKAKKGDPKHNVSIYPNDTVIVSRSWL